MLKNSLLQENLDIKEKNEIKSPGAEEIVAENPRSPEKCKEYWDKIVTDALNKDKGEDMERGTAEDAVNDIPEDTSENKDANKGRVFSSLDDMKAELEKTYKEIKADKPLNSPNIAKWFENGGKIEIIEKDGKTVWIYVNPEGVKVSYVDGYPVFPPETKHPNIKDISIGEFTGDRNEDKRLYLEKLEEEYGLTEIPDGYVLHHDSENGKMQLIKEEYHKEFTHAGGHSKYKEAT